MGGPDLRGGHAEESQACWALLDQACCQGCCCYCWCWGSVGLLASLQASGMAFAHFLLTLLQPSPHT